MKEWGSTWGCWCATCSVRHFCSFRFSCGGPSTTSSRRLLGKGSGSGSSCSCTCAYDHEVNTIRLRLGWRETQQRENKLLLPHALDFLDLLAACRSRSAPCSGLPVLRLTGGRADLLRMFLSWCWGSPRRCLLAW